MTNNLGRTKAEIRYMKESDWSAQELRELLIQELTTLKQNADTAYVDQLNYIEEVFEE